MRAAVLNCTLTPSPRPWNTALTGSTSGRSGSLTCPFRPVSNGPRRRRRLASGARRDRRRRDPGGGESHLGRPAVVAGAAGAGADGRDDHRHSPRTHAPPHLAEADGRRPGSPGLTSGLPPPPGWHWGSARSRRPAGVRGLLRRTCLPQTRARSPARPKATSCDPGVPAGRDPTRRSGPTRHLPPRTQKPARSAPHPARAGRSSRRRPVRRQPGLRRGRRRGPRGLRARFAHRVGGSACRQLPIGAAARYGRKNARSSWA